MLYNIELNKKQTNIDCLSCKYFNKQEKRCEGMGKCCFEYDPKTGVVYDNITHLPLKLKNKR